MQAKTTKTGIKKVLMQGMMERVIKRETYLTFSFSVTLLNFLLCLISFYLSAHWFQSSTKEASMRREEYVGVGGERDASP